MAHEVAPEAPGPREDNGGKFDLQDAVAKLDGEGDNQPGTGDMRMEDLHARGRLEQQLACCKVVQARFVVAPEAATEPRLDVHMESTPLALVALRGVVALLIGTLLQLPF